MSTNDRTPYLHLSYGADQSENRNLQILDDHLFRIVAQMLSTLIPDGSITQQMLAKPAVGTPELFDGAVTNSKIADGTIDAAKIASVAWSSILNPPVAFPPSGAALGDLTGFYPAPTIRQWAVVENSIAGQSISTRTIAPGNVTRATLSPTDVTPSLPPLPTPAVANEIVAVNPAGTALIFTTTPPATLLPGQVTTPYLGSAPNGVATGNINAGAVTDAQIANVAWGKVTGAPTAYPPSGAAGGSLTGTYPSPTIGPLAIVDSMVTSLSYGKLTGAPAALPPAGPAGGSLQGTYPNPTINPSALPWTASGAVVTPTDPTKNVSILGPGSPLFATLLLGTSSVKGRVQTSQANGTVALLSNRDWGNGNAQDDATKVSWAAALSPNTDNFQVSRSPAGSTAPVGMLTLDNTGALALAGALLSLGGAATRGVVSTWTAANGSAAIDVIANASQIVPSRPMWDLRIDSGNDNVQFIRQAPSGGAFVGLMTLDSAGSLTIGGNLAVNSTQLTVGAGSPQRAILACYASGGNTMMELQANPAQVMASRPIWDLRFDCNLDTAGILRQAPNNGAWLGIMTFDATGNLLVANNITTGNYGTAPAGTGIRLTGAGAGIHCQGVGSMGGDGFSNAIAFGWNGQVQCRVDATQQGSVNITPPSDERLKTDIREDVPGLDAILALRPVSFEYDPAARELVAPGRHYGLIAQEAQPHVPLVIEDDGTDDHYLGLDYRLLVPVLVKAVQELAQQLETR